MITKHKAEELACRLEDEIEADLVGPAGDEYARITGPSWKIIGDSATLLRTIPVLEAEIESLKRQLEAAKKLEYQKGYEAGSALTTYNKPRVEALEAEIERLVNHSRTFSPF